MGCSRQVDMKRERGKRENEKEKEKEKERERRNKKLVRNLHFQGRVIRSAFFYRF